MSCDLARARDQSAKWLNGWESFQVSHHPSKFGGHGHYGSGNKIGLVCQVISRDHVIKELFDFMVWSPSRYVTTLTSLLVIGIVVVCNGFSLSNDLTWPRDKMVMSQFGQEPIKASYHLAKFGGYSYSDSGVIVVLVCYAISQDHVIKRVGRSPS